jgi:hypothetical protein
MLQKGLITLVTNPNLIGKFCEYIGSMPNIESPTMGGQVFWDTLTSYKGWRLQKNKLTGHCRLLDPNDIRKAWGSFSSMTDAFERLLSNEQELLSEGQTVYLEAPNNTDIPNQIRQLGELLKDGLLTQEEFNQKKKELLSRL